jgi:hypothetical protein
MRILLLYFILLIVSPQSSFGQNDTSRLKIRVIDSLTREPLDQASIYVFDNFGKHKSELLTNDSGYCDLYLINCSITRIIISFTGYRMKILSKNEIPINKIIVVPLSQNQKELESITIRSSPLSLRGDTMEYKASQYYNGKNATLADVLRRIPGISIGKDGTITAFGKPISTIRINGEDLLLSDPTILSQNLPADLVDKVQLIDDKSQNSQLTGFDDGHHQEIINLSINKNKMNNYFGNLSGGYTNDNRYSLYARLFEFENKEQIAGIATANNINGRFNTDATSTGPPNNNSESATFGIGYGINQHLKATLGFSYNSNNSTILKESIQSFNLDTTYTSRQLNKDANRDTKYSVNLAIQYGASKTDSLILVEKISYSNSVISNADSFYISNISNVISNNGTQLLVNNSHTPVISLSSIWIHKFRPIGMTLVESARMEMNTNRTNSNSFTTNKAITNNQIDTTWLLSNMNSDGRSYFYNSNYVAPITNYTKIELSYSVNYGYSHINNLVYSVTPLLKRINDSLSNSQYIPTLNQNLSLQYKYERKNLSAQLGISVGPSIISNKITTIDSQEKTCLWKIMYSPYINLIYAFNRTHRFQIDFTGTPQLPSASQLQSIANYNNPLYIEQGNPNLKEAYNNTLHVSYQAINQEKGSSFVVNSILSLIRNEISTNTTIIGGGAQIIEPININGNYGISNNFTYNYPFLKNRLNGILNASINYNHTVGEAGGLENVGKLWTITPVVELNYTPYSFLRLSILSSFNNNSIAYKLSNTSSDITNFDFSQHTEFDFKNNYLLKTNIEYKFQNGVPSVFVKKPLLINIQLEKSLLKEKLYLSVGVNDLLNQNIGYLYQTGQGYTENDLVNYLTRYYIIEAHWKFQYHKSNY